MSRLPDSINSDNTRVRKSTETKAKSKQSEDDVELDVVGFLRSEGWTVDRSHVGLYYTRDGRPVRIGRVGQCDWRGVRRRGSAWDYLEVETKATGKTPDKPQLEYIALRNHQGIPCCWADSLGMFREWYQAKGFAA